MPIRYPGGTTIFRALSASTRSSLLANLESAFTDAGWVIANIRKAYIDVTFNGIPGNNQTATFAGVTYRFVNALSQAYDVKIGSVAECAVNFRSALIADPSGAGTKYHGSTQAHPNLVAELLSPTVVRISWNGSGYGNGWSSSNGWNNVTLSASNGINGGPELLSARTPQGLQMRLLIVDDGTYITMAPGRRDGSRYATAPAPRISVYSGKTLSVIINKYQYFTYIAGSTNIPDSIHYGGVPFLRAGNLPLVIASLLNNGGLAEAVLNEPHGLVSGAAVYVAGANVPALNGAKTIEVTGPQSFVLNNTPYQDGYEADSGLVGTPLRLSDCIWASGYHYGGFNDATLRQALHVYTGNNNRTYCHSFVNATENTVYQADTALLSVGGIRSTDTNAVEWYGGLADLYCARIGFVTAIGNIRWYGDLWGAFCLGTSVPMDTELQNFDGHNWINFTHNSNHGSLWLMTA